MSTRIRRLIAGLAVVVAVGVVTLFVGLAIERRSELILPAPTGTFAVGRTIFDWRDEATVDTLAPLVGAKRELLVWIWYPSAIPKGDSVQDHYIPAPLQLSPESIKGPHAPRPLLPFRLISHDASRVRERSTWNAAVSTSEPRYPVAVLRAGASAGVLNYSTIAEDLASYGYVVVAFDAPYRTGFVTFPDGRAMREPAQNNPELCVSGDHARQERCADRLVGAWTSDIGFVLDRLAQLNQLDSTGRFTGRIDLARVGVFGHSFGGAVAAQFCHDDPRCKAGVDIDGAPHGTVIQEGLRQPFMFVLAGHGDTTDVESRQILSDIAAIYDRSPKESRTRVRIPDAFHFTFSDDGALLKSHVFRGLLRLFGVLHMSGPRQLAVTAYAVRVFFDAHVKESNGSPRLQSSDVPELQLVP